MADFDEYIKKSRDYADRNGFELNPNPDAVKGIVNGLFRNEEKYGEKYCPCRRISGNKEEDLKIICPCIYHKEEIAQRGHCSCHLFHKKKK